jgi:lipoprotein-anchoring transpeptidase ErfK/SrfK
MVRLAPRLLPVALMVVMVAGCAPIDRRHAIHISTADQQMLVTDQGQPVAVYPVSTSKFGLSSRPGSYGTPLGKHRVAKKIGHGLPHGAVFKSRRFTGEVLPVDAPGRDPIVTRILWLRGLEPHNGNSFARYIYIHGTPEERNIGRPVSYGCVRMRSRDVVALFDRVGVGAKVDIFRESLSQRFPKVFPPSEPATAQTGTTEPALLAGETPGAPRNF